MPKGLSLPTNGKFEVKEVGESFDTILECMGEEVFQSLPCVHMEPFGYGLTLFVSGGKDSAEKPKNATASLIARTPVHGNAFLINETNEGMPVNLSLDDLRKLIHVSNTEFTEEKEKARKKQMVAEAMETAKAVGETNPEVFEFMMQATCGKDWKDYM
mmetsp:Transcript_21312/g.55402  ORF Transcript_21312/g.55402 Transcript_21312/m.55402 type:complete len:158 (-) Transcript_21312:280-753(-)